MKLKTRFLLAAILMLAGTLLLLIGILAFVVGHYYSESNALTSFLLAYTFAVSPPTFLNPVATHLAPGLVLLLIGSDWHNRLRHRVELERIRHFLKSL